MFQLIYDDLMYTRHCFDGKEGSEVGDGERPSSHGRESVDGVCVLARRRINRMPAREREGMGVCVLLKDSRCVRACEALR